MKVLFLFALALGACVFYDAAAEARCGRGGRFRERLANRVHRVRIIERVRERRAEAPEPIQAPLIERERTELVDASDE